MKEISVDIVLRILNAAAEDWKMDMLTHIYDVGLDGNNEPYVNCKDIHGRRWFLDLDGIYAESEDPDEL